MCSGGGRVIGVGPGLGIAAYKVFDRYRYTVPAEGETPAKVVDDIGAFDGPVFAAIVDAAQKRYPVINMSLGSSLDRSTASGNASWLAWDRVARYANRAGTLIVGSAGNDAASSQGTVAHIPSDLPGVLNVSATGSSNLVRNAQGQYVAAPGSDVLAFYSNVGSAVDVSAPGGDCGPGYPASCVSQYLILSTIIQANGAAWYGFAAGTDVDGDAARGGCRGAGEVAAP
jgi:lantibiotic leader peptide-processing serine protease